MNIYLVKPLELDAADLHEIKEKMHGRGDGAGIPNVLFLTDNMKAQEKLRPMFGNCIYSVFNRVGLDGRDEMDELMAYTIDDCVTGVQVSKELKKSKKLEEDIAVVSKAELEADWRDYFNSDTEIKEKILDKFEDGKSIVLYM